MKMPVTHLTSLMEINESKSYLSYLLILFLPNLTSSVLFFLTAIIMSFVEKEMATHSVVLAWRIPGTGAWWAAVYRVAELDTTEVT